MFITKKSLSRRTVLRGFGATLALPLLDAMVPALTAMSRTAAAPVSRFGAVYIGQGAIHNQWIPTAEGVGFPVSPILKPIEQFKDQLLVVSGLDHKAADPMGDGIGDHSRGQSAFLSGAHAKRTAGGDVRNGPTLDQIFAKAHGKETPLPSLELSLEAPASQVGSCENGYACVYSNTFCWASETDPLPMENYPRRVFERLFGDSPDAVTRSARLKLNRSILDSVQDEAAQLQQGLGVSDRRTVTQYLDAVREVEQRIQRAERQSRIELPELPLDIPESFDDYSQLMLNLWLLAYQADITRVVSLLLSRETSMRAYPQISLADLGHNVSHHRSNPRLMAEKAKLETYHIQLFSYLLERMRATPDGDGSLLDHVMILYGSGLGDGNVHDHKNLPVLVAGGGSGRLNTGRHIKYPDGTSMTNLLVTLMDKSGLPVEKLGDSTGMLDLESPRGV